MSRILDIAPNGNFGPGEKFSEFVNTYVGDEENGGVEAAARIVGLVAGSNPLLREVISYKYFDDDNFEEAGRRFASAVEPPLDDDNKAAFVRGFVIGATVDAQRLVDIGGRL